MRSLLLQVEGVLAEARNPGLVDNVPIPQGMVLWHALRSGYEIVTYSEHDPERVEYWLAREHVVGTLKHYQCDDGVEALITKARFNGNDLALMVTANPDHARAAYRQGLQALLSVHPSYGRPEWQPDYDGSPRAWDTMVEEVVQKRMTLAADQRTHEKEPTS